MWPACDCLSVWLTAGPFNNDANTKHVGATAQLSGALLTGDHPIRLSVAGLLIMAISFRRKGGISIRMVTGMMESPSS